MQTVICAVKVLPNPEAYRRFIESLGCAFVGCGESVTGDFDREPEPLPENLGVLSELVRTEQCAIGFAQDPDGDRLAIIDENGVPLGEDMTVTLAARQVLDAHGKGPVVVHMSTSRTVRAVAGGRSDWRRRARNDDDIRAAYDMRLDPLNFCFQTGSSQASQSQLGAATRRYSIFLDLSSESR